MPTPRRPLARLGGILLAATVVLAGCNAAAPAGRSGTPTEASKATPAIDTAAGIRYANAAVAALNKDPFVAHVEQVTKGTQEANGKTATMVATMSADFAGNDMGFVVKATAAGQKADVRLRVVGKNAWIFRSGLWIKQKRSQFKSELADIVDAVRVIKDPHDLRYMGEERVGKTDLQHFRANRALSYDSGLGFDGKYDSYDIWVTKDGTPVRVEATFSASSPTVGSVKGTSVMDFTKFGGSIKIKVPKNKKL